MGKRRVNATAKRQMGILLFLAEDDSSAGEVVGGEFYFDFVARKDADEMLAHFARDMGCNDMTGLEFDAKGRIGQSLDDLALELNCLFF